jgi:hypothetical protein
MPDDKGFTAHDFARDEVGHGTHAVDLDGQVHGFKPEIRDALRDRGLLVCDATGVWRLATHGFPDVSPKGQMGYLACCDFCGAQPAPWTIPCPTFDLPAVKGTPPSVSTGDWAACDTCGGYIVRGERLNFLAHCHRTYEAPDLPREMRRIAKKVQAQLHARFWQHYTGGATRGQPRAPGH